jgi:hypothetical protein
MKEEGRLNIAGLKSLQRLGLKAGRRH